MASGPGDHEAVARSGASSYLSALGWRPQKLMFSKTHPLIAFMPSDPSPQTGNSNVELQARGHYLGRSRL